MQRGNSGNFIKIKNARDLCYQDLGLLHKSGRCFYTAAAVSGAPFPEEELADFAASP